MPKPKIYTGRMFYPGNTLGYEVTRAIITAERIAIDWLEQGCSGGLSVAMGGDDAYRGRYRYIDSEEFGSAELRITHNNDGTVLLHGIWSERSPGNQTEGEWEFRLKRSTGK